MLITRNNVSRLNNDASWQINTFYETNASNVEVYKRTEKF